MELRGLGPPPNPSVRIKEQPWREAKKKFLVPRRHHCGNLDVKAGAWLWREEAESVVSEVLEELPSWSSWCSLESGQCWIRGLASWWGIQPWTSRRAGKPTQGSWTFGTVPCISYNTIGLHLSGGSAASEAECGKTEGSFGLSQWLEEATHLPQAQSIQGYRCPTMQ